MVACSGATVQSALTARITSEETAARELEQLSAVAAEREAKLEAARGENKQLRHQVQSLAQRLSRYENDVRTQLDEQEATRRREKEMQARLQQREHKLKQVGHSSWL